MALSKKEQSELFLERVKILFEEAKKRPSKANRYVELARKLSMRINVPLPKEYKRKFCKHCNNYFKDGNYKVRTKGGFVVYLCLKCNKKMRFKI